MGKRAGLGLLVGALVLWGGGACHDEARGDRASGVRGSAGDPAASTGAGGAGANAAGSTGGAGGPGSSPSSLLLPADSIPPGSVCEPTGWCWYNPRPSGATWDAVAPAGRTDLWVAGETPQALHFDGGHWTVIPSPLSLTLGIWAAAKDDVWFAGGTGNLGTTGAIAHWDGTTITLVPGLPASTELTGIWGSGPHDIYAIGYATALHWDGTAWTTIPGIMGTTLSGSGPQDVWIGNYDGMYRFDGVSWARPPQFVGTYIQSVSVVGSNDVWALTLGSGAYTVEHFDGTNLTPTLDLPSTGYLLLGLEATSDQDVWLVGGDYTIPGSDGRGYLTHYDGSGWTRTAVAPTGMIAVQNAPGLGTFAVGYNGGLLRLSAAPQPGFTDLRTGPAEDLSGTFGTSPTDMWAVGNKGTILHFDGHSVAPVSAGVTTDLSDVWGTSSTDVWAVGAGGTVLHFDGHAFVPVASSTNVALRAVFTARPNDVWIGGDASTLLHWDGSALSPVALPGVPTDATIYDIHGIAPNDIWLVCGDDSSGAIMVHYDGTTWSPTVVGGSQMMRVWILATNDVWTVSAYTSSGGVVHYAHFDGTTWDFPAGEPFVPGPFVLPNRAGGSFVFGPHDRWIVGNGGLWQRSTM